MGLESWGFVNNKNLKSKHTTRLYDNSNAYSNHGPSYDDVHSP